METSPKAPQIEDLDDHNDYADKNVSHPVRDTSNLMNAFFSAADESPA